MTDEQKLKEFHLLQCRKDLNRQLTKYAAYARDLNDALTRNQNHIDEIREHLLHIEKELIKFYSQFEGKDNG